MDSFNPGGGGGDCSCEMDDECSCEVCEMWREVAIFKQKSDGAKQFLLVASDGFRDSMHIPREVGSHLRDMIPESELIKLETPDGHIYPIEVSREFGALVLRSGWHKFVDANHIQEDYSILFVHRENSIFKVHIFDPSGHQKSSSRSQPPSGMFGAVPPCAPCDFRVLNEQVVPDPGHVQTSNDIVYTTLPGCCLTEAQDEKVLQVAESKKSEIPLHVSAMNKINVSLKDSCVYIALQLVLDRFKSKKTEATIQLKAPDKNIYSVGANKHGDDQIVIESGWNSFVASLGIQEKDLLIFRSTEKSHLEVLILDPSSHEKTSSCFVMGNSFGAQETSGDSVHIVDPPPPAVTNLSSSDNDDIVKEGTRESCRSSKRVTRSCAKTQKIASTSSPSTKSGPGARKPRDRACEKLEVGSKPLPKNLEGPSQQPYFLSMGRTLPWEAVKKIKEKVQALRSELPIFVKVMTISTVDGTRCRTCQMNFSMEYAEACLPDKSQKLLLQLNGKKMQWQTTLNVRSGKHRQISGGWTEFSRQHGLEVGDICLFKLEDTNISSLKMIVYLIRKSEIEL